MIATKVFSIEELLEMILLNMPQHDLFVLQRVSRTFASTILSSHNIQQKMLTPTAQIVTESRLKSYVEAVPSYPQKAVPSYLQNMQLSPFMPTLPDWISVRELPFEQLDLHLQLDKDTGHAIGWQGKTSLHVVGSWRKMMLLGKVRVLYLFQPEGRRKRVDSIEVAVGRTFGDMVEALEKIRVIRDGAIEHDAALFYP